MDSDDVRPGFRHHQRHDTRAKRIESRHIPDYFSAHTTRNPTSIFDQIDVPNIIEDRSGKNSREILLLGSETLLGGAIRTIYLVPATPH
jgi:hypothetical protein